MKTWVGSSSLLACPACLLLLVRRLLLLVVPDPIPPNPLKLPLHNLPPPLSRRQLKVKPLRPRVEPRDKIILRRPLPLFLPYITRPRNHRRLDEQTALRDVLARTYPPPEAEVAVVLEVGVGGQGFLVGGVARFQPALGDEGVGVGVEGFVAVDGPLDGVDEAAFADEVAVVDVVAGGEFVGEATGGDGAPAQVLFHEGAEVGDVGQVGEGWGPVGRDVFVDFGLQFGVFVWVQGDGEHEGHHAVGGCAGSCFEAGTVCE